MKELPIAPQDYPKFKAYCALNEVRLMDVVVASIQKGMAAGDPGPLRTLPRGQKTWSCKIADDLYTEFKTFCAKHRVHPCVTVSEFIDGYIADTKTIY